MNVYITEDLRTYPGASASQIPKTFTVTWQQNLHDSLVWNRPVVPPTS
jgi:hypothetical protein